MYRFWTRLIWYLTRKCATVAPFCGRTLSPECFKRHFVFHFFSFSSVSNFVESTLPRMLQEAAHWGVCTPRKVFSCSFVFFFPACFLCMHKGGLLMLSIFFCVPLLSPYGKAITNVFYVLFLFLWYSACLHSGAYLKNMLDIRIPQPFECIVCIGCIVCIVYIYTHNML